MSSPPDFNSPSESSPRALTPSTRSSDDESSEPSPIDVQREGHEPRRLHPRSTPVRPASNYLHPPSPYNQPSARPFVSSPLAYRTGPTISPTQAFTPYANLNSTFGSNAQPLPHSLDSALRQAENSPSPQHHSAVNYSLHNSPPPGSSYASSPPAPMTPPQRSFWDPLPEFEQGPSESPFMGASSSSHAGEVDSAPDESRKRTREHSFTFGAPSSKSLRTTPSPGPPMHVSDSDPLRYDPMNDPGLAALFGDDPAAFMETQRQIEEDAKTAQAREKAEAERRDHEYALSVEHELNASSSLADSAPRSTWTPPRQSMPPPTNAYSSHRQGGKHPVTPLGNSGSPRIPQSSARLQGPPSAQIKKEIKEPGGGAPGRASKPYKYSGEYIVLDDSDDEPEASNRDGQLQANHSSASDSRPSTSQSNIPTMDLTNSSPSHYHNRRQAQRNTPGSWSSYSAGNQHGGGNQPNPGMNGYTPTPQGANGYHGAAGSGVYNSSQATNHAAAPQSAFGAINQGIHGLGRAMADAATNAASGILAYGGLAGYGDLSNPLNIINPNLGYQPTNAMPGGYAGSQGYPVDVDDDAYAPYGSSRYRQQSKEEVDKHLRSLVDNIQGDDLGADERTDTPDDMADNAALYKHQIIGLKWMVKQEEGVNKGGILADDMGLGKTIQAIALIVSRRSTDPRRKTTLIVAPVALLRQWESELKIKVKPERRLTTFIYHSKTKGTKWPTLRCFDVVLTTYGTLASEYKEKNRIDQMKRADPHWQPLVAKDRLSLLGDECKFYRVIVDEAQNIKNRKAKTAMAVHCLNSLYRFCMTGTPMMNNITELYSLIQFLGIKPYNDWERFRKDFDRPMRGSYQLDETMQRFQAFLKACLLRRTKKTMIDGQPIITLPDRVTMIDHAVFDEDQQEFYNSLEKGAQRTVNKYLARGTVGKNYTNVLELLLRLRQACDHPHLIKNHAEKDAAAAGGVDGATDNLLKLALEALTPDAVSRLKEQDGLECAVCMDVAGNATIFTPCGHYSCSECFTKVSDPANLEPVRDDGVGEGTLKFRCIHCRALIDPRRVTNYDAFKRAHMPDELEPQELAEDEETEEHVKDLDLVTDSEDESSSDDESDAEPIDDFIDDRDEDQLTSHEDSDKDEESDQDSDENDDKLGDYSREEFERRLDQGLAYQQEEERKKEEKRKEDAAAAKNASMRLKDEDGSDDDEESGLLSASRNRSTTRASSRVSVKQQAKEKKSKKGKQKKAPKRKSLSMLQKESRSSVKAREKYMKLLKKRWVSSAKIEECVKILTNIGDHHPNEKTIVFSQFTTFLDLVEIPLADQHFGFTRYDGSMSPAQRADAVDRFTRDPRTTVMLVSLKAGNAGLNLTVANHIVLLDPFWNPYIEEQAIDRAHRIGQRREVRIHRILIAGTVEDRIIALQEQKRQIIEGALDEQAGRQIARLGVRDLTYLFGITSRP